MSAPLDVFGLATHSILPAYRPAIINLAVWRPFMSATMKLGPAWLRRWVVERIPSRRVQRLRGIIDIMDTHARRLVADKIAVVRGESGEGAAFADVDSESTDIMSTMDKTRR